jgi:hypothetical protein
MSVSIVVLRGFAMEEDGRMKRKCIGWSIAVFLLVAVPSLTHASPITLSFTAGSFGVGSPVIEVSGSITYDAPTVFDQINSLISIDLSIDGFDYTLADVDFAVRDPSICCFPSLPAIFGTISGRSLTPGTDDFLLLFDHPQLNITGPGFFRFAFTTSSDDNAVYDAESRLISFRGVGSAVPIPAALPLFATGLGVLGFVGWRRRKAA